MHLHYLEINNTKRSINWTITSREAPRTINLLYSSVASSTWETRRRPKVLLPVLWQLIKLSFFRHQCDLFEFNQSHSPNFQKLFLGYTCQKVRVAMNLRWGYTVKFLFQGFIQQWIRINLVNHVLTILSIDSKKITIFKLLEMKYQFQTAPILNLQ